MMDRIPWWRLKLTVVVLVDQGGQRQQRWAAWLGLIRSTQQRRRRQGAAHALTFAVNRLPSTKAPNLSKAVKYSGDIYGGDRHFWLIQIWGSQNTGRCSHRACMREWALVDGQTDWTRISWCHQNANDQNGSHSGTNNGGFFTQSQRSLVPDMEDEWWILSFGKEPTWSRAKANSS